VKGRETPFPLQDAGVGLEKMQQKVVVVVMGEATLLDLNAHSDPMNSVPLSSSLYKSGN
jgi:hypothetical protein